MLCTLVANILYWIIYVHYLILYVPRETLYLICSTWNVIYVCICLLVLVYVTGICVYIDYILSLYGIIILCVLDYYPCVRDYYFVCAGLYIRRLLLSYIFFSPSCTSLLSLFRQSFSCRLPVVKNFHGGQRTYTI